MLPVMLGSATNQMNQLVDKIISSSLGEGMVSVLSYTAPLQDFVMVAFSSPIVTVLFTELSSSAAKKNLEQHKYYLINGISILSLLLVPVSIITVLLSKDIVTLLYQRGAFNETTTLITAGVLSYYGIGFLFYGIHELVARSFYSLGDTKTPTFNGILTVIANIIFSIIFSRYLGVGGIALATSIAGILSMMILTLLLRRKLKGIGLKFFFPTASKILASSLVMTVGILGCSNILDGESSILRFFVISSVGLVLYALMLTVLKCRELVTVYTLLKSKFLQRG